MSYILLLRPCLQPLCQCPQITRRDLHALEGPCTRVVHALFDDICLECALGGAQRVAAAIARRGTFAGHCTDTSHGVAVL